MPNDASRGQTIHRRRRYTASGMPTEHLSQSSIFQDSPDSSAMPYVTLPGQSPPVLDEFPRHLKTPHGPPDHRRRNARLSSRSVSTTLRERRLRGLTLFASISAYHEPPFDGIAAYQVRTSLASGTPWPSDNIDPGSAPSLTPRNPTTFTGRSGPGTGGDAERPTITTSWMNMTATTLMSRRPSRMCSVPAELRLVRASRAQGAGW